MHVGCSLSGYEESGSGVDLEGIRQVIREEFTTLVDKRLSIMGQRMRRLETEIFTVLKGAGAGVDSAWTDQTEALLSWDQWGQQGSGFGHLPAVTAEELVRRSEDSWDDAEKAPLVQMEVEDLLEEQRMSGTRTGPTKKGKGKKKEEESDEEDEEDEDVVAGGPEDSDEEDEEGGEEDAMEE
jgi:hypothetical protein